MTPRFLRQAFASLFPAEYPALSEKVPNGKKNAKSTIYKEKNCRYNGTESYSTGCSGPSFSSTHLTTRDLTSLIAEILCTESMASVGTVRDDACFALKQLLKSRVVSSRHHLASRSSFAKFLLGIDGKRGKTGAKNYSGFECINDVVDHCSDVSEYQMVTSLRFVLVFGNSTHISNYFLKRNIDFPAHCAASEELTKLAGVAYLINRFLSYSRCNEALLRHSISTELGPSECIIVLRLLSSALSGRNQLCTPLKTPRNAVQWIGALADVVSRYDGAHRHLNHVKKSLEREMNKTIRIVRLRDSIHEAVESLQKKAHHSRKARTPIDLAPYQIEKITL